MILTIWWYWLYDDIDYLYDDIDYFMMILTIWWYCSLSNGNYWMVLAIEQWLNDSEYWPLADKYIYQILKGWTLD